MSYGAKLGCSRLEMEGSDNLGKSNGSHGSATMENLVTWKSVGEALNEDCAEAMNWYLVAMCAAEKGGSAELPVGNCECFAILVRQQPHFTSLMILSMPLIPSRIAGA